MTERKSRAVKAGTNSLQRVISVIALTGKSLNQSVLLSGQEKDNGLVPKSVCSVRVRLLKRMTAVGQTLTGSVLRRSNQSIYKDEKRLSHNFQAVAGQSFLSSLNLHTSPAKFTNKLCKQTTVFYWQINDHILALLSR